MKKKYQVFISGTCLSLLFFLLISPLSLIFAQGVPGSGVYGPRVTPTPTDLYDGSFTAPTTINSVNDMYKTVNPLGTALINNSANNAANTPVQNSNCVGTPKTFKDVIQCTFIAGLIKPIVPLLVGLAVLIFIYGVIITMISEGGEKKEEGKQYMLWGIIGIFVMVSVWGLVAILQGTFGLDNKMQTIKMDIPTVNVNTLKTP